MTISNEPFSLDILSILPQDMMFRANADQLIDRLRNVASSHNSIVVDFAGTRSMTWSFAHEYLTMKKSVVNSVITETNVPDAIVRMLALVRHRLDSRTPDRMVKTNEKPLRILDL